MIDTAAMRERIKNGAAPAEVLLALCNEVDELREKIESMQWDLVEMDELNNMGD